MLIALLSYFLLLFGTIAIILSLQLDKREKESLNKQDHDLLLIHELRSPMSAIRAAADLLLNQHSNLDQDKRQDLIKVIYEQSLKILDHISMLLDSAKLDAGMLIMKKAPHDIVKLLNHQIHLFCSLAEQKHITMSLHNPEPIPSFEFDEDYIGQVINNLLSNALKFTPENGDISIHTHFDGKEVSVSIKDSGQGLSDGEQEKLFQKFSQATRDQPINSSGLGLYFAKHIVEQHGGKIKLDSVAGLGTVITFTLPLVPTQNRNS